MSGWIPNSSSASLVVGPMDAITMRRRPLWTASSRPVCSGNAEQMRQLDGGGEHRDIGPTLCDPADRFTERRGVFGQIPLIHPDGCDFRTTRAQSIQQFQIRFAVFLNSDSAFGSRRGGSQQLAPGVWLRYRNGDRNLHLAQYSKRFGAARDYSQLTQRLGEGMRRIARSQHFIQRARADAREQDHHVEFTAEEPLGECEGFGILFDGGFPHGGRDEWVAPLAADQFSDFSCAPALEGKDAQAIKGHQPEGNKWPRMNANERK